MLRKKSGINWKIIFLICRTCTVLVDSSRKALKIVTDTGSFDLPEATFRPIAERIMARIRSGEK